MTTTAESGTVFITNFGPWFEAAFATNLAYSILLKWGKFAGKTVAHWCDSEKLRVIPSLAETPKFDGPKFQGDIDNIERTFVEVVKGANFFIIAWALTAAAALFVSMLYEAFYPDTRIATSTAVIWCVFLGGAVPIGLLMLTVINLLALRRMRLLSNEFTALLKYTKEMPEEALTAAKEALRKRLKDNRTEQKG